MRTYRNAVLHIPKMFLEHTLSVVPRRQNVMADSLATTTSNFKIPIFSNRNFEIHVKHRPIFLDNLQYWQVFRDDKNVNNFLQNEGEFKHFFIDEVYDKDDQVIEATKVDILQLKDNNIPRGLIPFE